MFNAKVYRAYLYGQEILKGNDYGILKQCVIHLAQQTPDKQFVIREDGLPSNGPANFTVKRFGEKSPESVWYEINDGIHATEFDGKTIQINVGVVEK